MCSIGVTNKIGLENTNQYSVRRGPDETTCVDINGIEFLHNLLHLTGEYTPQPFFNEEREVAMVFNGEIYNYKDFGDYKTDGEAILDLYLRDGNQFARHLDGEFAICIVDFQKNIVLIAVDTFATKPLWYSFEPDQSFGVASYKSQLEGLGFSDIKKLEGNRIKVFSLKHFRMLEDYNKYVKFSLSQEVNYFDRWIEAFTQSIEKRTQDLQYGCFLGLSSGYDSGAIACELLKQGVDFKSYSIVGPENQNILQQRVKLIPNYELIELSRTEYDFVKFDLDRNCEDFTYKDQFLNYNIKGDKASMGLGAICRRAKEEGRRIYFSGQGADEIISDYGFNGNKIYGHSSFGGRFPEKLEGFFPWHSFYDGTQIQYLNKEEYVAGHYGIETRYPFLDKQLVQEFLNLTPQLKNSKYKSAIDEYLKVNNFPYSKGEKIGFNTLKGLK